MNPLIQEKEKVFVEKIEEIKKQKSELIEKFNQEMEKYEDE